MRAKIKAVYSFLGVKAKVISVEGFARPTIFYCGEGGVGSYCGGKSGNN